MEASNILHQVMTPHHTLEDVLGCSKRAQQPELQHDEEQQQKRPRSEPEQALRCPRCDSANTKFCYYNNYSLSQPRYFCKGCRRYWTQGGTLRNVPVGGGCRKNRRPSPSSSATSSQRAQDQQHSPLPTTNSSSSNNPLLTTRPITHSFPYDPTDLTLAFARLQQKQASVLHVADHDTCGFALPANTNPSGPSFLDILRGGFVESGYQNLFYGFGDGNIGGVDQEVVDQGPVFPFGEVGSGAAGTGTQESSKSGDEDDGKPMMGLQWQTGGGENINMLVDYGRDYWGNVGNPWHGLVNSSLM